MAILLQITSGRGPAECCWVVKRLAVALCSDAQAQGIAAEIIESENGPEKETLLSALIHLDGQNLSNFCAGFEGTVQWIGTSPFRPGHKRRNWFAGVQHVALPQPVSFLEHDIRIETMKGSGPGGQHVNTTESAVRAIHIPSGLMTIARDERSQTANRKRALERLAVLLARRRERELAKAEQRRWEAHNELVRGNPIRVYEGPDFRLRVSS